jgi:TPR repeat protein
LVRHRPFAIVRVFLPLIHLGRGNIPHAVASMGSMKGRTSILIGYANAMYQLGWRYERGTGTPKNLPEATRCYTKSARLGNLDAMVRLAPAGKDAAVPVVPIVR